jgi:aryl-alcohol dehydrogenase-like predicted oxidoreductase
MKMVKLGNTDLKVTQLAVGAWAIAGWQWGGADENESLRAMEAALDMGITSIDTAPVYGFGYSEELVGQVIRGKRDKVQVMTKFGLHWDTDKGICHFKALDMEGRPVSIHKYASRDSVMRECEQSLKRLKTDYIDLYQIHWPDITTPIAETMEAVERLIQQGKVRAAGVSNYSASDMKEALKVLPIASNQVPYSMVCRDIEEEVVPFCLEHNVGILVYSPLQRGVLAGRIKPGHHFRTGDHRPDTPYYKLANVILINEFLDRIRPIAENRGVSLAQLVLRWTLQRPGITCILAGFRNEDQLAENAGALEFELSPPEMDAIEGHIEKLELVLEE